MRVSLHDLEYLFWECTLRCDLHCLHCGSDCISDPTTPDMPLDLFLGVLNEVAGTLDPGKVTVCLTGGEPSLREDLEGCVGEISARGFPVGMVTNGWSMTEKRLSGLASAGLGALTVSLDGERETHDRLRGRKGSFERACRTLRMAAESTVRTDAVTCVNPGNLAELPEVMGLLVSLGVKRWRLAPVFPRGRAAGELVLDRKGLLEMLAFIRGARETGRLQVSFGCEGYLGEWEGVVRDNGFHCLAGISIGSVLANGSISGCPSMRGDFIQGSIATDRFMDVWEKGFHRMRDRRWARIGHCADCRVWKDCLGGPMHMRDGATGELIGCQYLVLQGIGPEHDLDLVASRGNRPAGGGIP